MSLSSRVTNLCEGAGVVFIVCVLCATCHLEVVVFVRVFCEQVFGALDVIGQLCLCQVSPKLLQHLGCGFHSHGKVLYSLEKKTSTHDSAVKKNATSHTERSPVGLEMKCCLLTHGSVVYPLAVTVLQASSELPRQLAFVHEPMKV